MNKNLHEITWENAQFQRKEIFKKRKSHPSRSYLNLYIQRQKGSDYSSSREKFISFSFENLVSYFTNTNVFNPFAHLNFTRLLIYNIRNTVLKSKFN